MVAYFRATRDVERERTRHFAFDVLAGGSGGDAS
jgi:hypothetical protein